MTIADERAEGGVPGGAGPAQAGAPPAAPAGREAPARVRRRDLVMRVTGEGRIVRVRAAAAATADARGRHALAPLLPPAPGETLAAWLAAATGAVGGEAADDARAGPVPVVLVVRGRPGRSGPELLIAARRTPATGDTGAAAGAAAPIAPASPPAGAAAPPAALAAASAPSAFVPAPPAGPARVPRRLVGFKRRRMFLFDPGRVLAFELRGGLVHATFEDGESYTTNYAIRELESRLPASDFFRIHRDVILNLNRVKEIERVGQGRLRLLLDTPDARGFLASRPASARLRKLLRL